MTLVAVAALSGFPEIGAGQPPKTSTEHCRPLLASVAWKRLRRGEIDEESARLIVVEALTLPMEVHQSGPFIGRALELALETEQSVYDCLYLAVAIAERAVLVTADERVVRALEPGPFAKYVRWIGGE